MYNSSSFVYAPFGTILTQTVDGKTKIIPLEAARKRWLDIANGTKITPVATIEIDSANYVTEFWLYKEEYIDFENVNKPDASTHKFQVKNKGRIGMLFPIIPVADNQDRVYTWSTVNDDSIGWGLVSPIGEKLDPTYKPKNFNDLQEKIGRYILLTNVWSCTNQDLYRVNVDKNTLANLYQTVVRMTKGDMFVNVRRGRTAYGPLCVMQKNIVIENPEKFGLPTTTEETNLCVTQIFTSCESLTNKFQRKPIQYWQNDKLSQEEKSMCTIFQSFNNSVIASMQDEAYRDVMVEFWATDAKNQLPGNAAMTGWSLPNMKALMTVMFATAKEVIFQKAASKVACPQRLVRLSSLLSNYAYYFQQRKCLADAPFVKNYEEKMKKEMVDLASFNGMLAEYTASASLNQPYNNKQKPVVSRPSLAEIDLVAKMHAASSGFTPQIEAWLSSEARKAAHAQDIQQYRPQLEQIRGQVKAYVVALVNEWSTKNVSYETAEQTVAKAVPGSLNAYRSGIALLVYKPLSVGDQSTDLNVLFDQVYTAFVNNHNNSAWLNLELNMLSSG
jgi:hypothetical protein